jgi:hypothetical protein
MKLYDQLSRGILAALNAAGSDDWTTAGGMGGTAALEFYTTNDIFTGTAGAPIPSGLFGTGAKILFDDPALVSIDGGGLNGTQATGAFAFTSSAATVATNGIASYFAILNTDATSGVTLGNVVITGSVSTSGGAGDIKFNVVDWSENDQVSITALTFVQPR